MESLPVRQQITGQGAPFRAGAAQIGLGKEMERIVLYSAPKSGVELSPELVGSGLTRPPQISCELIELTFHDGQSRAGALSRSVSGRHTTS